MPTTPAQAFHMLRRQMLRPYRKPLSVMTPKSLLRHKMATSAIEDLSGGHFHPVIGEIDDIDPKKVKRVIMCSGKVYYDLLGKRREQEIDDVAILRIEQLYPFPYDALREAIDSYHNGKEYIWCQEEPRNQGAWYSMRHRMERVVGEGKLRFAGRPASASPAVGYFGRHARQQAELVAEALGIQSDS